jgi:hypothetical protein
LALTIALAGYQRHIARASALFSVNFKGDILPSTVTAISTTMSSGFPAITLSTTDVEKVSFASPTINTATLTDNNVAVEMLRLATEVYGPQPTLGHKAEPLRWQAGGSATLSENISLSAQSRGWHPVSAMELGMAPADFEQAGPTLEYSFVGRHCQAIDTADQFVNGDTPEADALVFTGLVNGERTLALVFRRTDQIADFNDYPSFARYYAKYQPLIQRCPSGSGRRGRGSSPVSGNMCRASSLPLIFVFATTYFGAENELRAIALSARAFSAAMRSWPRSPRSSAILA